MDPQNMPFELISYRGLLKSLDDINKGNFMKRKNTKPSNEQDDDTKNQEFGLNKLKMLQSVKTSCIFAVFAFVNFIETILYFLMSTYDDYVYSPLQKTLSPIVKAMPRYFVLGGQKRVPIFTANIVTLSRTFLVIPIAWFLKYDYNFMAFLCVVLHDFLDHLDGIVAKVQRVTYPNQDDPMLGGFLDAFCDKIVNVMSIWTILQTVDLTTAESVETTLFLFICYAVVAYETVIGVVRVQDFFLATFKRDFGIENKEKSTESADPLKVTAASMEGKLKEKLESMGIAFLCMAIAKHNSNPITNGWGLAGLLCLLLTLRMAHKSLALKISARMGKKPTTVPKTMPNSASSDNLLHLINLKSNTEDKKNDFDFENAEMKMVNYSDNQITDENSNYQYKRPRLFTNTEISIGEGVELTAIPEVDTRVDKVYTVGCFDLFHYGHIQLIKRMRELGKRVIVGVHDSRSIYKLKNRVPVDSTEKRMLNVKSVADEVFCISGTDPSAFMTCIVSLKEDETALYVRGNDMPNFPSREVVENLMPIKFLSYTEGVSSTELRKKRFSHIAANDLEYLEKIN